ncbi:hypothetical protein [Pleurocapsa sp. PCC 7319]|uniref:hypothetical protein n=1 Tax=Pleurocapsa sp. PCC 7319 TaxID=118161 RepID=UPI0003449E23|nr:hypothetical protein [Pleurocapsa sp. PCC 7319]
MSSFEKRLAVFRKIPLRAQLATITSSKANSILNQNQDYIASLEQIHAECLANATPEEKLAYNKAKEFLITDY